MKRLALTVLLLGFVSCNEGGERPPETPPDAAQRTCSQSHTTTIPDRPPCTWEWNCDDRVDANQYSAHCTAGNGRDVSCECRAFGVVTGSFTLEDGCISFVNVCESANVGCNFHTPIDCPTI
jgi:hypothetical protein